MRKSGSADKIGVYGALTKVATQIRVRSTCRRAAGTTYDRQHVLDLSELKGISRTGKPPLLKIAKSMEKMQQEFHNVATGFQKPKIDVFTHDDRERERKEWEERGAQSRQLKASE